jgi:hypothetical protein
MTTYDIEIVVNITPQHGITRPPFYEPPYTDRLERVEVPEGVLNTFLKQLRLAMEHIHPGSLNLPRPEKEYEYEGDMP